jgi:two-component system, OmpR family, sensor histidine kinase KdpD
VTQPAEIDPHPPGGGRGRGRLRIYLGSAPGVGKTYAMLCEAHRRHERGTDVVVGFVETHGRARTATLLDGLEVVPRRTVPYRGTAFEEMDLAAVLARAPQVVVVDELAHTNVPDGGHDKRWKDVEDLLAAGIDVLSTVNIQHLESLNDVVQTITGVPQRETIPDEVVRAAEQVELIDITPEALRRRMAHGNIYAPDKVDAALGNYFRVGNLTALRELALLWLAGKVDEQLDRYRAEHGIASTWETRERVVVALTGGGEGDTLIRRAARIAARNTGADLLAVHVTRSDGLTGANPANLARQRALVESLGGSYHQVIGDDIPKALLDFARAQNTTQLVLGASRRGGLAQLLSPGIGVAATKHSGSIDVHMVTHEEVGRGRRLPSLSGSLTKRRRLAGAVLAAVLPLLLTVALTHLRGSLNLTSDVLLFLLAVVAAALVGGLWPATAAAVAASLLLNYYFIHPLHRWTIAERNNALALAVFIAVGGIVATVVDLAARRTSEAAHASAEAEALSTLAGDVLRGDSALPALLDRACQIFGLTSVALLERTGRTGRPGGDRGPAPVGRPAANHSAAESGAEESRQRQWRVVAASGPQPCQHPEEADSEVPISPDLVLALRGRTLPAQDRRVLAAFGAQAAVALRQQRLADAAAEAAPLAEANRTRTALLAAVSHDLRTPLASAKAAVTSLRSPHIAWAPAEQGELLATADESLDRLTRLVENLLDMSRLQAGALSVRLRPVGLDDVLPPVLDELGPAARDVDLRIPPDLPEVRADPGLLERIVANLTANALRHSPPGIRPTLSASALADRVELRVVDRGPGIPEADWDRVFTPFQRLGDRDNTTGVGLGLALSRGLAEAMGGTLSPENTPGGGLTMVLTLPAARTDAAVQTVPPDHDDTAGARQEGTTR